MNHSLTAIAGLCAGLTLLTSPALSGPEQDKQAHAGYDRLSLEEIVGEVKLPELFIGSKAPELQIAKYVKGDSVEQFQDGKVYVVEFWATWCGPCIAAFPHLSELQAEHKDDAQFIGVNIWERFPDQATRINEIEKFVADQGDRMSYTVAVEVDSKMSDTWMLPAGQNGIPAAFIVDGTGTIAWVGHPMAMDAPLESVIEGNFDASDAIENYKNDTRIGMAFEMFESGLKKGGDIEQSMMIANILSNNHASDPGSLNRMAWSLLASEHEKLNEKHYQFAYDAMKKACEKTNWEMWMLLDTYAKAAHKLGKNDEAVKWQTKAIELMPEQYERYKPELEAALETYKNAG